MESGSGAARVTMEIEERGLPIHEDAELKIRPAHLPRGQLLRGPRARLPVRRRSWPRASTIPVTQTAAPVQIGDVLTALQKRHARGPPDLPARVLGRACRTAAPRASTRRVDYWEPAYRNSALANDATLGIDPDRDLQRVLDGQQQTFAALTDDEGALKDLVTNFNVTAGRARPRGRGAGRHRSPRCATRCAPAQPALASLNAALPDAARLRPRGAARRALLGRDARRRAALHAPGAAADVRARAARHRPRAAPDDPRRGRRSTARRSRSSSEGRALSACTNNVLVPFTAARGARTPTSPTTTTRRSATSSSAASSASPARAASRTATTSSSTPAPGRPASRCGPGRRPTAAACRRRTAPTCPARPRSCPNLHAPGGPICGLPGARPDAGHAHQRGRAGGQRRPVRQGRERVRRGLARDREGAQGMAPRARPRRPPSRSAAGEARDPQAPRRLPRRDRRGGARPRGGRATSCPTSACASR